MGFVVQGRTHCAPLFCAWRACLFALTLCVPLSRKRARGIMECGSEASAHAEADASALQTCPRAAPLSHDVGEGLGVRAEGGRALHTVNPSDVPLSALTSPVNRGGAAAPSPPAGRVGVGAMFKSLCTGTCQSPNQSSQQAVVANPLLKVPPASGGNRTGARLGSPREAGVIPIAKPKFTKNSS